MPTLIGQEILDRRDRDGLTNAELGWAIHRLVIDHGYLDARIWFPFPGVIEEWPEDRYPREWLMHSDIAARYEEHAYRESDHDYMYEHEDKFNSEPLEAIETLRVDWQDENLYRRIIVFSRSGSRRYRPCLGQLVFAVTDAGRKWIRAGYSQETRDEIPRDRVDDADGLVIRQEGGIATASPDFLSVEWFGQTYSFTKSQANVVGYLWANYLKGTYEAVTEELLHASETNARRMSDIFKDRNGKSHPAWGTMVCYGPRGRYWLGLPANPTDFALPSSKNHA